MQYSQTAALREISWSNVTVYHRSRNRIVEHLVLSTVYVRLLQHQFYSSVVLIIHKLTQLPPLFNSRLEFFKTVRVSWNCWVKSILDSGKRELVVPHSSQDRVPFHRQTLPSSPKSTVNTLWSIKSWRQIQVPDQGMRDRRKNRTLLFTFLF